MIVVATDCLGRRGTRHAEITSVASTSGGAHSRSVAILALGAGDALGVGVSTFVGQKLTGGATTRSGGLLDAVLTQRTNVTATSC